MRGSGFLFLAALACASAQAATDDPREGEVRQVVDLGLIDADHQGLVAIVGMRLPLYTGNDIVGEGTAKDVAEVAALLSKDTPGNYEGPFPGAGKRVVVRLKNGVLVVVLQPPTPYVFTGQRVRIEGGGRGALVVGIKPQT